MNQQTTQPRYPTSAQVTVSAPTWLEGGLLAVARNTTVSALEWLSSEERWLSESLLSNGAILLRGFAETSIEEFERIATVVSGQPPQPYTNRSTPRTSVKGNIYTSTEYPASEVIPLHNENSYSDSWPSQILFLCTQPAAKGGGTPIVDSRRIYFSLSSKTREKFEAKGVTYLRNYGVLGLSWQETFQTSERESVEAYCRLHDIKWEWIGRDYLRTRQTLPAVRPHPVTRERVWFNQAHLFHLSNLGETGDELLAMLGKDGVPRNAFFGDGSDIELDLLSEIRAAYDKHGAPVAWVKGDLIILDNMLWAHGRHSYSGARRVLVAMTKIISG